MNDELTDHVMRFDPAAYALALERTKTAPLELVDRDFVQLTIVSPALATEAYESRRTAQLASVQPAPPVVTTTKSLALPARPARLTMKHLDSFSDALSDSLVAVLKKSFDPRDARVAALEARVLELEASLAARPVQHADR